MELDRKQIGELFDAYWGEGKNPYNQMMYISPTEKLTKEKQDALDKFLGECESVRGIFDERVNPMAHLENQEDFCHALSKVPEEHPISHRLYFNYDMNERITFAKKFINACAQAGIPFYIKWSRLENRADNTVVYISNENLSQTCEIIKSIGMQNPELTTTRPMPMPVKDFGWFGYGVENESFAHMGSYNSEVAKALTCAFVYAINENRDKLTPKKDVDLNSFGNTLFEICEREKESQMSGVKNNAIFKNAVIAQRAQSRAYFKEYFEKYGKGILNRMLSNGFGGDIDGPANSTRDILDDDNIFTVRDPGTYNQMVVTPQIAVSALSKYFEFKNSTLCRMKLLSSASKIFKTILEQKGLNFKTPEAVLGISESLKNPSKSDRKLGLSPKTNDEPMA